MKFRLEEADDVRKKSWGIGQAYISEEEELCIPAVDMETGEYLCDLWCYSKKHKSIKAKIDAYRCLNERGYSPSEHGNKFDGYGRIYEQ